MKNSALKKIDQSSALDDLFAHTSEQEIEESELETVAIHLSALMSYAGKTRAQMAQLLGWQRNRITRVLASTNLELKTIYKFSHALGYKFDVVFRDQNQPTPHQPWNAGQTVFEPVHSSMVSNMYANNQIGDYAFVSAVSTQPQQLQSTHTQIPECGNKIPATVIA